MGIEIEFYKFYGDPRTANKNLGNQVGSDVTLQPLEAISNLEVRMIINYNSDFFECNYFTAESMVYHITGMRRLTAEAMEITGRLDSVASYWDKIKKCPCMCDRTADAARGTFFINDPILRTNQYTLDETISLKPNNIFGYNGHILLMTVG